MYAYNKSQWLDDDKIFYKTIFLFLRYSPKISLKVIFYEKNNNIYIYCNYLNKLDY